MQIVSDIDGECIENESEIVLVSDFMVDQLKQCTTLYINESVKGILIRYVSDPETGHCDILLTR